MRLQLNSGVSRRRKRGPMPFLIYRCVQNRSDLALQGRVSLAGRAGPLAAAARAALPSGDGASTWHLSGGQLLEALGWLPSAQHRLIVDLKPNVPNNVSLYRVLRVWGHSSACWTPVALRLQPLFVDRRTADPNRFKKLFKFPALDEPLVHEFLYLQGGFRRQPKKRNEWQWGRNGLVNAALLWPDALSFFINAIQAPEPDGA